MRRYIEEGYDLNHLANAGKYVSAMLAAAARWKYAVDPSPFWLAVVIITSTEATLYQLYWDFVKDWGLFNLSSKNLWLRDDLILKNKSIYYASIVSLNTYLILLTTCWTMFLPHMTSLFIGMQVVNFVLRLAWIETIFHLNLDPIEYRSVDFLLASLEIIRRGHWNFYRYGFFYTLQL